MFTSNPIEGARAARRRRDFPEAERILNDALHVTPDSELREELLRQLFYLYFSPVYEDLAKSEWCLSEIEKLKPSAQNAVEWALFMMNCRRNPAEAAKWAELAVRRAEDEETPEILYSAAALVGLLAAKRNDLSGVQSAVIKLRSLAQQTHRLPFGDEVLFLEASLTLPPEIRRDITEFARYVVPFIEDQDYRARAERVARAT
ncbi:MAG: hypothetical protein WCC92_08955 [Candidatus Korobacteraceae bacterium]